jgi:putative DNA primase/helicase
MELLQRYRQSIPTAKRILYLEALKSGSFHPFGEFKDAGMAFIGEGVATMAAVFRATKQPCIAAMDTGNLINVARIVREASPNAGIVFMADNDYKEGTESNPGKESAIKAVKAVGGYLALPDMGECKCDFWDVLTQIDVNNDFAKALETQNVLI